MKKITIILTCLVASCTIFCQEITYTSMGIHVGAGVSSLKGLKRYKGLPAEPLNELVVKNRFAWDFGLSFQTGFRDDFFFQTECNVGMIGAGLDGVYNYLSDNKKVKIKTLDISSMQLNLYLGKKKAFSDNFRLFVSAGPYIDWDFGESFLYDNDKESIINGLHDADFKGWDFGLVIAAGFEYGPWQISLNPRFGFIDISKDKSGVYHRVYKMAVTYHFLAY